MRVSVLPKEPYRARIATRPAQPMSTRRQFLSTGLAAAPVLALGALPTRTRAVSPQAQARDGARSILILGGTGFLGPHLVKNALDRGHTVSVFNRGRTVPALFPEYFDRVEHLEGDRNGDLASLVGRSWDAVIDNSGQQAAWTRDSAQLLKDRVDLYVYTSSTGVYYPYYGSNLTEDTPLVLEAGPDANEDLAYGVMKAQSELEARRAFGDDRTIVVRPTYIIGPGDRSNRFPYWPARLERGGEVLVPGRPDDPVQWIDARDLTEWMIRLVENRTVGTFNAVAPTWEMGMRAFVHGVHAATTAPCTFVQVDDNDFLLEHGVPYVVPWIMPTPDNYGSARVNFDRAVAAGLRMRPLAVTALDTIAWWHSDSVPEARRQRLVEAPDGLMAREAGILAAWRARG